MLGFFSRMEGEEKDDFDFVVEEPILPDPPPVAPPEPAKLPTTPEPEDPPDYRVLLDVLPEALKRAVLNIPPDVLKLSERELSKHFKKTQQDNLLRTAFWLSYNQACEYTEDREDNAPPAKMSMRRIFTGICSEANFRFRVIPDPYRMAYLILPPASYALVMEEALTRGLERVREILELPLWFKECRCADFCRCHAKKGFKKVCRCLGGCICAKKFNAKAGDLIIRATEHVDNRLKGSFLKRVDQRNVNVNLPRPPGHQPTAQDIDAKLAELELKTRPQLPPAKEDIILTTHQNKNEDIAHDGDGSQAREVTASRKET